MTDATDQQDALLNLLGSVRAVMFDFDQPVTDLFGGASTKHIADRIKRMAEQHLGPLDSHVEACDDSHGVLRLLRDMYEQRHPKPRCLRPFMLADAMVTEFESESARTAVAAPHIVTLVDLLCQLRMRRVIVSNNAERPIREYVRRQDPRLKFERVFGRDPKDARHMKPDPHCLERALEYLSLEPSSCLVIGDQPTDLKASMSVGVRFLGYTWDEIRQKEMKQNGADAVVSSHLPVIKAARTLLRIRRQDAPAAR